ncbi:dynamin family protein [Colletotrichum kahawae]|uniref:Dynamin family protein n=1 Tax=Colletotrichum kahawae TaxID=34407 RepID=A0AAD9YAD9_COLKA|nr:dynamin family protein [Colletotrichum kahawae]
MADKPPPQLPCLRKLSEPYAGVLDALDSLKDAGFERELVPKLVVIGDQNSGKSSVLEAICQIPFPVNTRLCTRFPTEVIQRKADKDLIIVTISPAAQGSNDTAVKDFERRRELADSTESKSASDWLESAITEATSLILGGSRDSTFQRRFSHDVLKITVMGPNRSPLTLVDLPGLWSTSSNAQDKKDKGVVDAMVRAYLEEPRNVFLLVISARSRWNNLRAPQEVEDKGDSSGLRTLGVITELDAAHEDKDHIVSLFHAQERWNPGYGWHGLRNRSKKERKDGKDRDQVEKSFFNEHWNQIEQSQKGIAALRPKLTSLLAGQVRRHLHSLIGEVRCRTKTLTGQIETLEKRRTSEHTQRNLLSRMAGEFQQLCCNAVNGQYGEGMVPPGLQAFFNGPTDTQQRCQDKRLQAVVRALGQLFNSVMIQKGKSTHIEGLGETPLRPSKVSFSEDLGTTDTIADLITESRVFEGNSEAPEDETDSEVGDEVGPEVSDNEERQNSRNPIEELSQEEPMDHLESNASKTYGDSIRRKEGTLSSPRKPSSECLDSDHTYESLDSNESKKGGDLARGEADNARETNSNTHDIWLPAPTFYTKRESNSVRRNLKKRVQSTSSPGDTYSDTESIKRRTARENERGRASAEERSAKVGGTSTAFFCRHLQPEIGSILRAHVREIYEPLPPPIQRSFADFESKVLLMAAQWRGIESLDEVNTAMVSKLFREENKRWRSIANTHLNLVWEVVYRFTHLALEHCVDPGFLPDLKHLLIRKCLEHLHRYAEEKLEELLRCHDGMNPATHDFISELDEDALNFGVRTKPTREKVGKEILQQLQSALSAKEWGEMVSEAYHHLGIITNDETSITDRLFHKMNTTLEKVALDGGLPGTGDAETGNCYTAEQAAVRRAIFTMEKYYKASLVSFVSYVNAMVVHNGLLEKLPYEIFTPDIVSTQTSEIVSKIAGEKEDDVRRRAELAEKLSVFEDALRSFEDFQIGIA